MAKLEISKVHDAYGEGGECPLCLLMDAAERNYLVSFQGSRVMEPNVRVKTNEAGFCPDHYQKLYKGENKLGLALVVHTHLQKKLPELKAVCEGALAHVENRRTRRPKDAPAGRFDSLSRFLDVLQRSCFICDMLSSDLDRYVFTVVYLWKNDTEFLPVLRGSRGFCLGHFPAVLAKARDMLRDEELDGFLRDLVPLMVGSLESLEKDLFSFTQLFHDANRSLGSEAERTALTRTLQKLAGCLMKRD